MSNVVVLVKGDSRAIVCADPDEPSHAHFLAAGYKPEQPAKKKPAKKAKAG